MHACMEQKTSPLGPDFFSTGNSRIDSWYLDGVSVTHGSPPQHIWTFATGVDETDGVSGDATPATCSCVNGSTTGNITFPHLWARITSVSQA